MRAEDVIKKAVKCLDLCNENYSLDNYLDDFITDSKERAKLSSLLYYYYRNKLTVNFIIDLFANRKIKSKVRTVLSVAVTQMFYQESIRTEVIVDSAVNYAKKVFGKSTAGFVNAVLRNIERNKETIPEKLQNAPLSVKTNIPDFVLSRWGKYYSESEVNNIIDIIKKPRFLLCYRFLKNSDKKVPIYSSKMLIIEKYYSAFMFYITENSAEIVNSNELKNGEIYIQDPATSLAVSAVKFEGKGKILDACSAPGGKTLMLAELYPDSVIYASDRSAARLKKVEHNIRKSKLKNIKTAVCDILKPVFDKESFDVVFLDVPCSNSGVVRKRPDALWKLTDDHLESIKLLQKDILNSAKELVKKNGKLVYSTCSIEFDENAGQVEQFLKNNNEFKMEFQQQLIPDEYNDGAYVAVLVRN